MVAVVSYNPIAAAAAAQSTALVILVNPGAAQLPTARCL